VAAELHPFPRVVEALPDPVACPVRQRLAEAIAAFDRARGAVELAAEPVRRLSDVIAEHDRLAAQLRELVDRDQAATGAWIAGGRQGADPGDAADTPSLVDRVAAMQPELAAARRTLPAAEQRHRAAIERLGAAAADRDVALGAVAVTVADDVAGEWALVREWGRRGSPGTVRLSSYQRRNEAETAEQRTIKRRLQHGYRDAVGGGAVARPSLGSPLNG
jgi:predicted DNA-binding WGR domain protein